METTREQKRHFSLCTDKNLYWAFVAALAGAIIVCAAFFLPYGAADKEYRQELEQYSSEISIPKLGMNNKDIEDMSMPEYIRTYLYAGKVNMADEAVVVGVVVVIGLIGILSCITLLLTILKKPAAVMIVNTLVLGAFRLLCYDFEDRGVIGNSRYNWGIAYYLYYIGIAVIYAGAVWMFIIKRKQKKTSVNPAEFGI